MPASSLRWLCLISARHLRNEQPGRQQENMHFPSAARAGLEGPDVSCALVKHKGPSSDCRQIHRCAVWLLLPTTLKGSDNLYVWSSELLHYSWESRSHNDGGCMATNGHLPSFTQPQASSLPSVFPQYSWRKRVVSPGSKLSYPKTGKPKIPNLSLLPKRLGWLS